MLPLTKTKKHSTDSSNSSVSGESDSQIVPNQNTGLGSLIAAVFCRTQRGLVREQLVQSATRHPPAHTYTATLCFTICSSTASFSTGMEKSSHFSASGIFFPPVSCVLFTCNGRHVSPTCCKRDMRARSHPTVGASKRRNHRDESTEAAVTLTRHGSQRKPSSAPGFFSLFFFFLLSAVYAYLQAAEGKRPEQGGGIRCGGLFSL